MENTHNIYLSFRTINSIKAANIKTIDELFSLSYMNELSPLGFSKKSIQEIMELRDKYSKNKEENVYKLDRFTPLSNGEMLEDTYGEYVLFSSVLNLFAAKK